MEGGQQYVRTVKQVVAIVARHWQQEEQGTDEGSWTKLLKIHQQAALDSARIALDIAAHPRDVPRLMRNYFGVMARTARERMATEGVSCATAKLGVAAENLTKGSGEGGKGVKDPVKVAACLAAASLMREVDDRWVTRKQIGDLISGHALWQRHEKTAKLTAAAAFLGRTQCYEIPALFNVYFTEFAATTRTHVYHTNHAWGEAKMQVVASVLAGGIPRDPARAAAYAAAALLLAATPGNNTPCLNQRPAFPMAANGAKLGFFKSSEAAAAGVAVARSAAECWLDEEEGEKGWGEGEGAEAERGGKDAVGTSFMSSALPVLCPSDIQALLSPVSSEPWLSSAVRVSSPRRLDAALGVVAPPSPASSLSGDSASRRAMEASEDDVALAGGISCESNRDIENDPVTPPKRVDRPRLSVAFCKERPDSDKSTPTAAYPSSLSPSVGTRQVETQRVGIQHIEIQRVDIQQTDSQRVGIQQAESQQVDIQQADVQQASIQQADIQQVDMQQVDSQQVEIQQVEIHQLRTKQADIEQSTMGDDQHEEDLLGAVSSAVSPPAAVAGRTVTRAVSAATAAVTTEPMPPQMTDSNESPVRGGGSRGRRGKGGGGGGRGGEEDCAATPPAPRRRHHHHHPDIAFEACGSPPSSSIFLDQIKRSLSSLDLPMTNESDGHTDDTGGSDSDTRGK